MTQGLSRTHVCSGTWARAPDTLPSSSQREKQRPPQEGLGQKWLWLFHRAEIGEFSRIHAKEQKVGADEK